MMKQPARLFALGFESRLHNHRSAARAATLAGPALPHNGEDASVLALAFDKQPLAGEVVAGGEYVPGNLIKLVGDRDEICRAVAPQRLKYPVAKRRRPFRLRLAALEVAP